MTGFKLPVSRTLGAGAVRLWRREPWWAEFWSGLTAIGWGGACVAANGVWPSMAVLAQLGGQGFWEAAGLGLGFLQLALLLADARWLRWAGSAAMAWFWGVLTLGVWAAVPGAPGVAIYAGWCGINLYSSVRLLRPNG